MNVMLTRAKQGLHKNCAPYPAAKDTHLPPTSQAVFGLGSSRMVGRVSEQAKGGGAAVASVHLTRFLSFRLFFMHLLE